MYSSQKETDILFGIYKDSRTVFRINDIALLINSNDRFLYQKLNRLVKKGKLLNIRKGIYAKEDYKSEELACLLYTPTYISLGYVLQRSGIIFQYDNAITNISYLNREISVNGQSIQYRQIKREILLNTSGIINKNNTNSLIFHPYFFHLPHHFPICCYSFNNNRICRLKIGSVKFKRGFPIF